MTKIRDECEVVDNVTDLGSRLNILSRLNGNRMPVFLIVSMMALVWKQKSNKFSASEARYRG